MTSCFKGIKQVGAKYLDICETLGNCDLLSLFNGSRCFERSKRWSCRFIVLCIWQFGVVGEKCSNWFRVHTKPLQGWGAETFSSWVPCLQTFAYSRHDWSSNTRLDFYGYFDFLRQLSFISVCANSDTFPMRSTKPDLLCNFVDLSFVCGLLLPQYLPFFQMQPPISVTQLDSV